MISTLPASSLAPGRCGSLPNGSLSTDTFPESLEGICTLDRGVPTEDVFSFSNDEDILSLSQCIPHFNMPAPSRSCRTFRSSKVNKSVSPVNISKIQLCYLWEFHSVLPTIHPARDNLMPILFKPIGIGLKLTTQHKSTG